MSRAAIYLAAGPVPICSLKRVEFRSAPDDSQPQTSLVSLLEQLPALQMAQSPWRDGYTTKLSRLFSIVESGSVVM